MTKQHKGIFVKPGTSNLYLRFTNVYGEAKRPPSGFVVGQEEEAAKLLAKIKRQIEAEKEFMKKAEEGGELPTTGVTVRLFGQHWNKRRLDDEATEQAAREDAWKLKYIYDYLGHILITEFRTKHGLDFIVWLKKQEGRRGPLGGRTVRSIWSCLHYMLHAAVRAELIPVNPCVVDQKDLPAVEDKDPEWRDTAVFERHEVEAIISDERIPEWRRVLWALLFFTSARPGEAFALPWAQYDTRTAVLGRLTILRAWNTRRKKLGKTKTKRRRLTPVHPTLARILAKWKLSGWAAHMGRQPKTEDLIIPSVAGGHLRVDDTLDWFREDLAALELPRPNRRQYDLRRSFKSLAEGDGASPELLRWVMWGSKGDVADGYSSMPWAPVCNEVAKLSVELLEGQLVQLRAVSGEKGTMKGTISDFERKTSMITEANTGTRTPDLLITKAFDRHNPAQSNQGIAKSIKYLNGSVGSGLEAHSGQPVPLSLFQIENIGLVLRGAAREWGEAQDVGCLRKSLTAILDAIEGQS